MIFGSEPINHKTKAISITLLAKDHYNNLAYSRLLYKVCKSVIRNIVTEFKRA